MEKVLETTAKTIDAAIAAALEQLQLDRDQVTVEVLEKPKSGFLGLGGAPARVRVTYSVTRAEKAGAFLRELLMRMNSPAVPVITEQEGGNLSVELTGSGLGLLIGHRGDTLDAIQHLTNYAVNRGEETMIRVSIDAQDYRAKRVESLQKLAQKMAAKVLKYRKSLTLEPMNAYERHIIHAALQDMPGLTTHSVGVEPHRRVVVSCPRAPGDKPFAARPPRQPGYRPGGPRPMGDRPRSDAPRAPGSRPGGDRSGRDGGYGFRSSADGGPRQQGGRPAGQPRSDGGYRPRTGAAPYAAPPSTGPAASQTSVPGPRNPQPYDRIPGANDDK